MLNRRQWCSAAASGIAAGGLGALLGPTCRAQGATRQAYSLHIGVNKVDRAAYPRPPKTLTGCINDAETYRKIAKAQGFQKRVLLTDEAAKIHDVGRYIYHAADVLRNGDIFFISYAGHGASVPDISGDEDDGKDETWCLYDGLMLDDYLYFLWSRFEPGVRLVIASDSCHSGTVARAEASRAAVDEAIQDRSARELFPDEDFRKIQDRASARSPNDDPYGSDDLEARARELSPTEAEDAYQARASDYREQESIARNASRPGNVQAHGILLAACQDHQSAYETGSAGESGGVFTRELFKAVPVTSGSQAGKAKNYEDLIAIVTAKVVKFQKPKLFAFGEDSVAFFQQSPLSI